MARANADRAGVAAHVAFRQAVISDAAPPEGAPAGLVMVNPPYGARMGEARELAPLYRAFGQVMRSRFAGWRVGLVTSEPALAHATGLPFLPPGPPVPHGGLRVGLYRTGVLG
jgi:putative N6-adenine-specific DNA methylase